MRDSAMKVVMVGSLMLYAMLVASAVFANDATVTWTAPTQREDGTPLPANEIASYRFEYGPCASAGTWGTTEGEVTAPGTATSTAISGLGWNRYCFRGYTRDTTGAESVASNIGSKDFGPLPPPNPPGNVAVVGATAYELKYIGPSWSPRVALGREVGTVTRAAACGDYQWIEGGYYQVPLDAVEFSRSPKSEIVVTVCITG